jgi:hypothetical protein
MNHIYWVANSSTCEHEREEKWRSVLNHITDVHVHEGFKYFKECTHGILDREWIKPGMYENHKNYKNSPQTLAISKTFFVF